MGWDLVAYLDVDQEEFESLLLKNGVDREDWEACARIAQEYASAHHAPEAAALSLSHEWNEACGMHEVYVTHSLGFLRDDQRFDNRRYHAMLEKKVGKPFPQCLECIPYLGTREGALDVADALSDFFGGDERLMHFADWLRVTAKYCSTYELSC